MKRVATIAAVRRRQIRELDLFLAATPRTHSGPIGTGESVATAKYVEGKGLVIERYAAATKEER